MEHRCLKKGDEKALALSALAEVPDQYRAICRLELIGGGVLSAWTLFAYTAESVVSGTAVLK